MKRKARAALLGLVLLAGCSAGSTSPAPIVTPTGVHCAEGDPCWDCSSMGNKRCGPMVNGLKAEDAAHDRVQELGKDGNVWSCWSEINMEMPDGYEVICQDGNGALR
jgi:hypothetical protein